MTRNAKTLGPLAVLSLLCGSWGCATARLAQPPGDFSIMPGVCTNRTYRLTLSFPDTTGWSYLTTERALVEFSGRFAIFGARTPSRFLQVVVLLEDGELGMSNEDYQMAVKLNLIPRRDSSYREISLATRTTNGNQWLEWVFSRGGMTSTFAFFKRGTQNFSVLVETPDEAYVRRRSEIESIVSSFRFLP